MRGNGALRCERCGCEEEVGPPCGTRAWERKMEERGRGKKPGALERESTGFEVCKDRDAKEKDPDQPRQSQLTRRACAWAAAWCV